MSPRKKAEPEEPPYQRSDFFRDLGKASKKLVAPKKPKKPSGRSGGKS